MDILFAQSSTGTGSTIAGFLPMVLIFGIFYMFLIRPQSKQKKAHEEELKQLSKGDKILTRGGIYGTITGFQGKNDTKVIIDTGSGMKLNVARSYIAGLASNTSEGN